MLLAWFAVVAAAPVTLPPVDQCAGDASFARFRAALISAVERKDVTSLSSLMDERARLTFGGRSGKSDFRAMWASRPEEQKRLWREMNDVLALGCAISGKARVFP